MSADEEALRIVSTRADGAVELSNGSALIARELEILALMARGAGNREIADELFLSVHTIEYHATRIYEKLGVANRTQAALIAGGIGLLAVGPRRPPPDSRELQVPFADPSPLALDRRQDSRRDVVKARSVVRTIWVGLAGLVVVLVLLVAAGLLGLMVQGGSAAQYCFGRAIATPALGAAATPDATASQAETVCFETQEEAESYSRAQGLQYCFTDADKARGVAGEAETPLCFDSPSAARDFARQAGLQ